MSKHKNYNRHMPARKWEHQKRREGLVNRADTWSPNGSRKCKKRNRREAKKTCRDWL